MTHIPPEIRPLYGREPVLQANDLSEILNFCLLSLKREGTDYTQYGDMSSIPIPGSAAPFFTWSSA